MVASYTYIPTVMVGLLALSLPNAGTIHIARLQPGLHERGGNSIQGLALIAAFTMGILSYFALLLIDWDLYFSPVGFLASLFVSSEIIRSTMLGITAGKRDYFWLAAWRVLTPSLYLLILIFCALDGLEVEMAVVAVVAANAISAFAMMLARLQKPQIDTRFVKSVLGTALRLHPPNLLRTVRFNIDRLAVVLFMSANQVGSYFVAVTFASAPFAAAQQALSMQLLAEFSSVSSDEERNSLARRAALLVLVGSVLIFLLLYFFLPLLVPLLIGSEFEDVPALATVLAFGFVFRMMLVVATAYYESQRSTKRLTLLEISYLFGFSAAWLLLEPTNAFEIAWCVVTGFVANSIFVAMQLWCQVSRP